MSQRVGILMMIIYYRPGWVGRGAGHCYVPKGRDTNDDNLL